MKLNQLQLNKPFLLQKGTNWRIYDRPTGGTLLDSAELRIENGDDIYNWETNIIIPMGETRYVISDRVLVKTDEDGVPVEEQQTINGVTQFDDQGNPIMVVKEIVTSSETRTPITNEEGLQNANIVERFMPRSPILRLEKDGDQVTVVSSDIHPNQLVLESVYWSVYGDGHLLNSYIYENPLNYLRFVVPEKYKTFNNITVTCVHETEDTVSPLESITVNAYDYVAPVSGLQAVPSNEDFQFEYELISPVVKESIASIQLIDRRSNEVVHSFMATINNSIVIKANMLKPETTYELLFTVRPKDNVSKVIEQSMMFNTMPLLRVFYTDALHTYDNRWVLKSSATIAALSGYVEKRPDGRFLCMSGQYLNWAITDDGTVHQLKIDNPPMVKPEFATVELGLKHFALASIDLDNTQTLKIIRDNVGISQLNVEKAANVSMEFESLYLGKDNKLYYVDNSTNQLTRMVHEDVSVLTPELIKPRPDGVVAGTRFGKAGAKILVAGMTENCYLYDYDKDEYNFICLLPATLQNRKLLVLQLINEDLLFVDKDAGNNAFVFSQRDLCFGEPVGTEEFVKVIKGCIKSDGVVIVHDGIGMSGYFN